MQTPSNEYILKAEIKDKSYKISFGKGLYVLVTKAGGKLWRMKYKFNKVERSLSLGNYTDLSIDEAQELARQARNYISQGKDPNLMKKANKTMTINTPQKILRSHLEHLNEMRERLEAKKRDISEQLDFISYDLNECLMFIEETRGALRVLEENK